MITPEIRRIIEENTIGLVATVTPEGAPAVSPKATMLVLDEKRIGFTNLRSPQTIRNIAANPAVELNFIDVFRRKAARLTGTATYHERGTTGWDELRPRFATWDYLGDRMRGIILVDVTTAQLILSPGYDVGGDETQFRRDWLARYKDLHGDA